MAVKVTAKVKVTLKENNPNSGSTRLAFGADYADDRNKEWSEFTPSISLNMSVKDSVAEHFDLGQAFTLTFEQE